MKKTFLLLFGLCVSIPVRAVDFDFTADPPAAKGKVPMIKISEPMKIGGTAERTALRFGKECKPLTVRGTSGLTLDKGLTVAAEVCFHDKGGKNLQMLLLKKREWLLGLDQKNEIYFNYFDGKLWMPGVRCRIRSGVPHKLVLTVTPDRKVSLWCDGKLLKQQDISEWPETFAVGKADITLGGGWGDWGLNADIYRLRICSGVWNEAQVREFSK